MSDTLYRANILKNNNQFSQKAIDQMVSQLPGKEVLLAPKNNAVRGVVVSARQDGDFVVCEFTSRTDVAGFFAGPGYVVAELHSEGGEVIVDDVDTLCLNVFFAHKYNVPPICLAGVVS